MTECPTSLSAGIFSGTLIGSRIGRISELFEEHRWPESGLSPTNRDIPDTRCDSVDLAVERGTQYLQTPITCSEIHGPC